MKKRITNKQAKATFKNIICVGYCGLQTLLKDQNPQYYCSGSLGWNCDIYVFGDTAICTGYRPFGNIVPQHDLVKGYEDRALEFESDALEDLLVRFLEDATN